MCIRDSYYVNIWTKCDHETDMFIKDDPDILTRILHYACKGYRHWVPSEAYERPFPTREFGGLRRRKCAYELAIAHGVPEHLAADPYYHQWRDPASESDDIFETHPALQTAAFQARLAAERARPRSFPIQLLMQQLASNR